MRRSAPRTPSARESGLCEACAVSEEAMLMAMNSIVPPTVYAV